MDVAVLKTNVLVTVTGFTLEKTKNIKCGRLMGSGSLEVEGSG